MDDYFIGVDALGAEDDVARLKKNKRIGAAVGAGAGLLALLGWSVWRHYFGRAQHQPWSAKRIGWDWSDGQHRYVFNRRTLPLPVELLGTAAVGALAGVGAGYGVTRYKQKQEQKVLAQAVPRGSLNGQVK